MEENSLLKLKGFASLQNPEYLLSKLGFDFDRMKKKPEYSYAVFDFFMTAEHIIDWILPDTREQKRRTERTEFRIITSINI